MSNLVSAGVANVAYLGAIVLFILALGGLSHPESSRRGNIYGITGMSVALIVSILSAVTNNMELLLGALVIGGGIGLYLAKKS